MSILLIMFIVAAVSLSLSVLTDQAAEEAFPAVMMSAVGILFLFYCADFLLAGLTVLLILSAVIVLLGVRKLLSPPDHCSPFAILKQKLSPALLIFFALCIFALIYLRNSTTFLWDELRLWSAVPKALHYTNALQLGDDSLIFPIMRHYPPGMHLLIYLCTFFKADFQESQLFVIYALFVYSLFLPVMKDLKWKQYPLFIPVGVFVILLPCILTYKNGDLCYFYQSLYIDPVLGFLIAHLCWLSLRKPLSSGPRLWQFCSALFMMSVLKNTGILFSAGFVLAVLTAEFFEKRKFSKKCLLPAILLILSAAGPWLIWGAVTTVYDVHNHLSLSQDFSILSAVTCLLNHYWASPQLIIPLGNWGDLSLNLFAVLGIAVLLGTLLIRLDSKISLRDWGILLVFLAVVFSVFLIGIYSLFGEKLECAQRYGSSLSVAMAACISMLGLHLLFSRFSFSASGFLSHMLAGTSSVLVLILCVFYLQFWNTQYAPQETARSFQPVSDHILTQTPESGSEKPARVYLLFAGEPMACTFAHHRIYYNLIGSHVQICNFLDDTLSTLYLADIDLEDTEFVSKLAKGWSGELIDRNIEYIYIYSEDSLTEAIFAALPGAPVPEENHLYKVTADGDMVQLKDITVFS